MPAGGWSLFFNKQGVADLGEEFLLELEIGNRQRIPREPIRVEAEMQAVATHPQPDRNVFNLFTAAIQQHGQAHTLLQIEEKIVDRYFNIETEQLPPGPDSESNKEVFLLALEDLCNA